MTGSLLIVAAAIGGPLMMGFNRGWFGAYALMCGGLLLGGHLFGHVSDWSAQVVGGTDCDSQDKLTSETCPARPGKDCSAVYSACNQGSGNATRICQVEGGAEACMSVNCDTRDHDTLSEEDADGNACMPMQI
ncbi:hypothetical protein [Maioricimonas sp. JC845]|uniref:hypothetical protein n=1 Tax=Maioricimonas sp. JC845 TaxID=3232138 RepID=UPI00345B2E7F